MIATRRENTDREKIDFEALLWTFEQIIIIVLPKNYIHNNIESKGTAKWS